LVILAIKLAVSEARGAQGTPKREKTLFEVTHELNKFSRKHFDCHEIAHKIKFHYVSEDLNDNFVRTY